MTTGATKEEAMTAFHARVEELLALALDTDCRLAVTTPHFRGALYAFGCTKGNVRPILQPGQPIELVWDFVMLSPGEKPPEGKGWTIYERVGDQWRGRSA